MAIQLPMFAPESPWCPPGIGDLPCWKGAKRVSIDVETRDPYLLELGPGVRNNPQCNYIVGYSFSLDGDKAYYIPLRHLGGDNIEDPKQGVKYLQDQAKDFDGEVVGMHLNYDLDWLSTLDVKFPNVKRFRDVMLAETLIYELHNSYSLKNILARRGIESKDETLLRRAAQEYGLDAKKDLWQLPARFVGEYGEGDALRPLQLLEIQEKDIEKQNLWDIWNLESDLLPVLVKVRQRGIRVDFDKLDQIIKWCHEQEQKLLKSVYDDTCVRIEPDNIWKAQAIAPALEAIGMRLGKTPKSGLPNIDKALLANTNHPVPQAIARARKVNKLRTTFAVSVQRHSIGERIHATLVQIASEKESGGVHGGRFGRMSCENPNLQQQPSRDDFADMWRSIYIPELDTQWCCADISQQEPRWAAHFAGLMDLPGAKEMVRRYIEEPDLDNHTVMSEITGLPRKEAKIIGLGIMYGKGGYSLCQELGLPTRYCVRDPKTRFIFDVDTEAGQIALLQGGQRFPAAGEEGQAILDRYDANAPFVRKLSKKCSEVAKRRGFIRTVLGRKCRFPKDSNGNFDWTYRALNRLIQGSSADQMKKAMIEVDREGYFLQLQVHDELDLSISSDKEGKRIGDIIQNAVQATVPFKVDVEIGPSWGEIK
jgi:DNA polymerase I-like protein with 3'-5' exonuclease and polymerase domains